ncbi:MAG: terpene cyclase/mutase family protein [Planctomycetota bacterium]|jgi:hypothetical protein|nr:terpene cyclase/mutase family protein [Planctomycetota bacterium]
MILATLLFLLPQEPDASVLSESGRRAAQKGLQWLAQEQLDDGSWPGDVGYKLKHGYEVWNPHAAHLGVTSLAGMAFLAGGHVPGRGPYGSVVEKAAQWVTQQVRGDGYISANETRMYSHAFATLFLAEVYGMDPNDGIRPVLQRAADMIVASQNTKGGWRYTPHSADADMSVSACQVMALRAARNVGIQVPASTIDRAVRYVRDSAVRENQGQLRRPFNMGFAADPPGSFRYQPILETRASWALTAAGVTILTNAGVYADDDLENGLSYLESELKDHSAEWGIRRHGHYYFWYGHYYGVQAFHMAGGLRWRNYFAHIQETLLGMQNQNGSWPNSTGPGAHYSTATACLILQIPREYLPIFER